MKSDVLIHHQNKQIKHSVIKGEKSENTAYDANAMAHFEQKRISKEQEDRKQKMQSFMNSTKLNASKLYKEKIQKQSEIINSKKVLLDKQKDVKAKYTVVKKIESSKVIDVKPTKVEWKKAEEASKKIKIPQEKQGYVSQSDGDESGVDSEYGYLQQHKTPSDLLKYRQNIRNKMLSRTNALSY